MKQLIQWAILLLVTYLIMVFITGQGYDPNAWSVWGRVALVIWWIVITNTTIKSRNDEY